MTTYQYSNGTSPGWSTTSSNAKYNLPVAKPKIPELNMLARVALAQWPEDEIRTEKLLVSLVLPNGEPGRNILSPSFYRLATLNGYLRIVQDDAYNYAYVRTSKHCKQPNMAKKRDGQFPVSQDVHQCLVWGHPIWQQLEWAKNMNPTAPEIVHLTLSVTPYMWLGAKFGKLRWAVGKHLLEGRRIPKQIQFDYGTDLRVMCGMLRLGVTHAGTLALLPANEAQQLVIEALSRESLLQRVLVHDEN